MWHVYSNKSGLWLARSKCQTRRRVGEDWCLQNLSALNAGKVSTGYNIKILWEWHVKNITTFYRDEWNCSATMGSIDRCSIKGCVLSTCLQNRPVQVLAQSRSLLESIPRSMYEQHNWHLPAYLNANTLNSIWMLQGCGTVTQWVILLLYSSTVPGLILSSGYC